MTKKPNYYEVRRVPEDPWDSNNLLWRCDTLEEAERRLSECILRGADKSELFIAKYENKTTYPIFDLKTGVKTGYWVTRPDGHLQKIYLVE